MFKLEYHPKPNIPHDAKIKPQNPGKRFSQKSTITVYKTLRERGERVLIKLFFFGSISRKHNSGNPYIISYERVDDVTTYPNQSH